jgi:hypothetical protein
MLYGFLSGHEPLTPDKIKLLAMDERPIVTARRPRAWGNGDGTVAAAEKPADQTLDALYGRFDAAMRNVRSNIYLRSTSGKRTTCGHWRRRGGWRWTRPCCTGWRMPRPTPWWSS